MTPEEPEDPIGGLSVDPGLCSKCRFLAVVRSRTSAYVRCGFSDDDDRYPRYPPLPVMTCEGFSVAPSEKTDSG